MVRAPTKLKIFTDVALVRLVKVHVFGFIMILLSSLKHVLRTSYTFRRNLEDQVKGRSPKMLKSLIEVPNLVHVKVHVLSFNMVIISSQWRVLAPSYPFR